ncbi:MAG: hypothetical protein JO243_02225 [Solirubrobacterales bacterium]|nr:hypothetical protein [Solirubrobacterales bacterium]
MRASAVSGATTHVVVAGGGFAALETVLALRDLASERVRMTLVSPASTLAYRPAATSEAFNDAPPRAYDLPAIADDLGAAYHEARLETVAPEQKRLRLSSGVPLSYDVLVLAVGALRRAGVSGALMFRDQRDVPAFHRLLEEADSGIVRRLVFAVPSGCSWPLPLYELALLSATHAQDTDEALEITIVTPEPEPLAVFGPRAASLVANLLNDLDVRFVPGTSGIRVGREGALVTAFGPPIRADRVVAIPQLTARRITGVPATWWGFVPTDASGRMEGLVDVYAAGDMTAYPIKQGGLAAQQADRVAHSIVRGLGISTVMPPARRILLVRLLGGTRTLCLRTELDESGRATAATIEHVEAGNIARSAKLFGQYLTPYLERIPPSMTRPLSPA